MLSVDDSLSFVSWLLEADQNSCKTRRSNRQKRESLYWNARSDLRRVAEVGWDAPLEMPYYRASAKWVRQPGNSYHLWKTYDPYYDASVDKAVELYVRND